WWCRAERRYPPRRDAPTGESSPESSPPTSRPPSSSPRTASRGRRWPRTPSAPHGHGTPANNSVQVVSSSRSFQKIEPPNTPGGFTIKLKIIQHISQRRRRPIAAHIDVL